MRKVLFFSASLLFLAACTSSDSSEETMQNTNLIVGKWQEIEKGVIYDDGRIETTADPCDNKRVIKFFETGAMDYDSWEMEGDICTFQFTRRGEYRKDTSTDYPEANYYLIFYEIPEDAEEAGYSQITVSNNVLTVKGSFEIESLGTKYAFRKYRGIE